ncbi:MAG: hypothetical protein A3K10_12530 [Bacteroidetes bacterium RIFCSPLOWO2_12_FULL_31_6]|nr:MAG: hypothetical protein A3K10_12530 [Bacteroidetes bacterium RIFCSPLOWO2_12_FULL_31_6]
MCLIGTIYIIFPISPSIKHVTLVDGKFEFNNKPFYPIVLNYTVSLQTDGKDFWACSYKGYNPNAEFKYNTKETSQNQLRADMILIKDLGFNTVRIVGIGEPFINEEKNDELSINSYLANIRDSSIILSNDEAVFSYFQKIEDLLSIIDNAGLKAIFLLKTTPNNNSSNFLLRKFSFYFKDNATILALDLFNEPLYFDKPEKNKNEVYEIVKHWRKTVKIYAPQILVTIGLEGLREVFRWDPNILAIDFISYHPYEYEPEQVRNEIYWYGKYTEKPWIIGETAIPADNDSVTYEEQRLFAKHTLEQTYNCNGVGYSWWQYKDVDWHKYHATFLGVLNWNGETINPKGDSVFGTVKPVAKEFGTFNPNAKKDSCLCLDNYYNYSQSKDFKLTGFILDKNNAPIEGAVILGWNENWSHSYHTITKKDGSFELLGSYPFYHWMASATKYTTIRSDINPDTAKVVNTISTIDLGNLKIEYLSFLK